MDSNSNSFIKRLLSFPSYRQGAVRRLSVEQFGAAWLRDHGTVRPILIPAKEGSDAHLGLNLEIQTPTVEDISSALGAQTKIHTLDVATQEEGPLLTLQEWTLYWAGRETGGRGPARLLVDTAEDDEADSAAIVRRRRSNPVLGNELSRRLLEMAPTPAVKAGFLTTDGWWIKAPTAVRAVDLASAVQRQQGHQEQDTASENNPISCVSMSPKSAYTDFRLAPGGASTWMYLMSGQKVFALLPPTSRNLSKYVAWVEKGRDSEVFLAQECEGAAFAQLNPGDTLLIPPGWLVASAAPAAATMACGYFLRQDSLAIHLESSHLEEHLNVKDELRYPRYQQLMWQVALLAKEQLQSRVTMEPGELKALIEERKAASEEEEKSLKNTLQLAAKRAALAAAAAANRRNAQLAQKQQRQRATQDAAGGPPTKRRKRRASDSFIESEDDDDYDQDDDAANEVEWAPGNSSDEREFGSDAHGVEDDDEFDDDFYEDWPGARKARASSRAQRQSERRGRAGNLANGEGGGDVGQRKSTRFSGRLPPGLAAVLHAEEEDDESLEEDDERQGPAARAQPNISTVKLKLPVTVGGLSNGQLAAAPQNPPKNSSPVIKVKLKLGKLSAPGPQQEQQQQPEIPQVDGIIDDSDDSDVVDAPHQQPERITTTVNVAAGAEVLPCFAELTETDQPGLALLISTLRRWWCAELVSNKNSGTIPSEVGDPREFLACLEVFMQHLHYDIQPPSPLVALSVAPAVGFGYAGVDEDFIGEDDGETSPPPRHQQQHRPTGGAAPSTAKVLLKRSADRPRATPAAAMPATGADTDNVVVEESTGPKVKPSAIKKPSQTVKQGKPVSVKNRLLKKLRM